MAKKKGGGRKAPKYDTSFNFGYNALPGGSGGGSGGKKKGGSGGKGKPAGGGSVEG